MRRFVIVCLGLIIFWLVYRYRKFLLASIHQLPNFIQFFHILTPLMLFSVILYSTRLWLMVKKLGYQVRWVDCMKIWLAGFSSCLFSIKFGDAVKIYLLKKKGLRISHGILVYSLERFLDASLFLIFSIIFLGRRLDVILLLGLLALGLLILEKRKRIYPILRRWERFRKVEEVVEIMVSGANEFKDMGFLVMVAGSSLLVTVVQAAAFGLLAHIPLFLSLEAIVVIGSGAAIASPTPAGIGVWEVAVSGFISKSIALEKALAAVLVYRLFFLWIPCFLGFFFTLNR